MNGELDFPQALVERVGMLAGLPVAALERTWEATEMTPGAAELVATMRADGAHCVPRLRRLHLLHRRAWRSGSASMRTIPTPC